MTDWFFPDGMNHHELFAGVPGLQSVMQAFARRVAGLGKLPTSVLAPKAARRVALDVCIVGAGPSGMASALAFAKAGRRVRVIDDGIESGGVARSFGGERGPFGGLLSDFRDAVARGQIVLSLETTAGAFYGRDLLVVGDAGAEILTAATTVLAAGAHDGQAAFEGNDVPGVLSVRAAAALLAHGVLVGDRIAWVVDEVASPLGIAFAEGARSHGAKVLEFTSLPSEALGNVNVTGVAFSEAGERVLYDVDALVLDLPPCPSHELAVQVGARVRHEPRGYVVVADERGSIAEGVLGVGEMVGTALDLQAVLAEAERITAP
jgi:sarcosine oxidase, subunit alpha